ncbi:MAG: exopolysaccharide biosynthesis protein [Clostridia bacterium]|nr:exopolysaccharide biosynthesis protein [Clostridia bacterium]MDD4386480.1 exopolysaccharide biosynthesis protein [Clostridia bacterium]
MIDIHSHVIPAIDDGCSNINEALDMMRMAVACGITKIIATPHFVKDVCENYKSDILVYVNSLNNLLRISGINVSIVCGSEIMICPDIVDLLKSDKLCSLNNSRYVLIEFPMNVKIPNILKVINDVLVAGFIPIIAHPERYLYIQKNIDEAIKYVESGALLQLNLSSVIGDYGDDAKVCAIKLLKHNLIHLWGSDTHSFRRVYDNRLNDSLNEIKKIIGIDMFEQIVEVNPKCVLNDKEIKIFEIRHKLGFFS